MSLGFLYVFNSPVSVMPAGALHASQEGGSNKVYANEYGLWTESYVTRAGEI